MDKLFLKRVWLTVMLFLTTPLLWAQTQSPSVDEVMRSHDKIYVVMAVCIVVLVVLFLYLIRIDRKVSKKEKSV